MQWHPKPWENSWDFLPSFSGPLFGQPVLGGKQGFILLKHPFRQLMPGRHGFC